VADEADEVLHTAALMLVTHGGSVTAEETTTSFLFTEAVFNTCNDDLVIINGNGNRNGPNYQAQWAMHRRV
jgi:hypothetical protein